MNTDLNNIPFVKIYGPESIKTSDELYNPTRELVRRLVSNKIAITFSGNKGIPHIVSVAAKEYGVKGASFENIICHVFIGMDTKCLEDMCFVLNKLEKNTENKSKIILFDEPGWNIWERLNIVFTELMDRRRISDEVFERVVSTWNLSEIMDFVKLGVDNFPNNVKIEEKKD